MHVITCFRRTILLVSFFLLTRIQFSVLIFISIIIFFSLSNLSLSIHRWPLPNGSLVWWRKRMSWVCCVTARLPSLFQSLKQALPVCKHRHGPKCSSNTPSTMSRTKAGPTQTSSRVVTQTYKPTMNPPNFRWQEMFCLLLVSFVLIRLLLLFIPSFLSLVNHVNLVAVLHSIALFVRD